jgi:DNA-binding IclR family transcriptional regulator
MTNINKSDSSLKAIDILEALKDGGKSGLGITDVSQKTGLNVSTVHRIMSALTKREYILKDESTKKYHLSFKVLQFSHALKSNMKISELIHPYLVELSEKTGEAIHLMQQGGNHCVFVDKVDSPHPIGLMTYIGKQTFLHCSAGGKVILAHLSKDERDRIFNSVGLPRLTQHTITEREILEQDLGNVVLEGFSWNKMEDRDDVIGIAAPVFDASGKLLYAISVVGPSYRFTLEKARESTSILLTAARTISQKLGYC